MPQRIAGSPLALGAQSAVKFNRFWTIEVRAGWSLMTVHPVRTHNDENYRP